MGLCCGGSKLCLKASIEERDADGTRRMSGGKTNTPAAPWLTFTRLKASHTSCLGIGNGFDLSTGSCFPALDSAMALPRFGVWPKTRRSESVREMTSGLRHLVTAAAEPRTSHPRFQTH